MGCVSSHEQDEKKSIGSRRTSQYQQLQQQQQQVKLQQVRQQQPVNGSQHQLQQMQQKNATENGSAATQAPIQTGVAIITTTNIDDADLDAEAEFRRQHFDRTSILRHSKKRKKSNAGSNPASVNGTPVKPSNGSAIPTNVVSTTPANVVSTTPARVSSALSVTAAPALAPDLAPDASAPYELAPTKLNFDDSVSDSLADEEAPVQPLMTSEIFDVDQDMNEPGEAEDIIIESGQELKLEDLTASARVAALLAGPPVTAESAKPVSPPPSAPEATPTPNFEAPTPELLSYSESTTILDEIPDDALIKDISPLPTPPPTPPPSEIPSIIPEPETPTAAPQPSALSISITNGISAKKKNIVVTSTPLAKQLLSQQRSGIPTPLKSAATPGATATPSRIPKLASASSIHNGAHPKLVKTPSGAGKASAIPGSAGKGVGPRQTPNGQARLRTRRQAELEDQQRNGFEKSGNEENEDCGRLI